MPNRKVEKSLLLLLFFITIVQFSSWGYQSVVYILSTMFNVETTSTPLSVVVGLIAMVASIFVVIGAGLWWKEKVSALPFIKIGTSIFIFKNVLDLINETWVFSNTHEVVNQYLIASLAQNLGEQLFQLAFWAFVLFYFKYKITEKASTAANTIPQQTVDPQNPPNEPQQYAS